MLFTEIPFTSNLYDETLRLRDRVLRRPLGLSVYDEDLSAEPEYHHFGILEDKALLACLVIVPLDDKKVAGNRKVKLKQMAVAPNRRHQGLGRFLIRNVEQWLLDKGVQEVVLAARVEAVPFYQKLNYHPRGEEFIQVGIPHREMAKRLAG